jgi:hypothetical protein
MEVSSEVAQCQNCGGPYARLGEKDLYCIPCTDKVRATEKPQFLTDMEWVAGNNPAQNDFQRAMQGLLLKRPQDFLAKLVAAQKDYDAKMTALAQLEASRAPRPATESPDSVEVDEKEEKVEELIERLLKEAGDGR